MELKKMEGVGRGDLFRLDPALLNIREGWNARDPESPDNKAHIEELAQSIFEVGVKEPLTVILDQTDGKVYIDNGHMRYFAVKLAMERGAEIKSVPAKLADKGASEADRVFTQILANSGKPLTPLEMAGTFKRLIDFGWTEDQIAARAGKVRTYVADLLKLRAAPAAIQKQVRAGKISATQAIATIRKNKGDTGKAAKEVTRAVKTAEKTGKKKATAKTLGTKSVKTEMKEIFGRVVPPLPGQTSLTFAAADIIRIKEIFKLAW